MGLNKVPRALINETDLNATTLEGKRASAFSLAHDHPYLSNTHPSASFGYSSADGRIKHNGNDVKVLNSVNADTTTKWNGLSVWRGTQAQYNAISNKDANTLYLVRKG